MPLSRILFWDRSCKWWFHVAPFVYVGDQEVVLDREVPNPTRAEARCLDAARCNFQPLDVEALDCRPEPENANNRPNRFLSDGRPQYPCYHGALSGWRKSDLERAYRDTSR